jgi:anti-sigma-K factor RskA
MAERADPLRRNKRVSDVNHNLHDLLSAEYVLGTLRGPARRRYERALHRDFELRKATSAWEQRLARLYGTSLANEPPPPHVWRAIERRLFTQHDVAPPKLLARFPGLWDDLRFWRGLGLATASMVLVMAGLLVSTVQTPPAESERLALITNQSARPLWLIASAEPGRIVAITLSSPDIGPGEVCELWVAADDGTLRSVGILPEAGKRDFAVPRDLRPALQGAHILVSIEPAGGSPAGTPTGEVIFSGPLVSL